MKRLILICIFFASGCAYGSSVSVGIGPKFLPDEDVSWTLGVAYSPLLHFPAKMRLDREVERFGPGSTAGISARATTGIGTNFSSFDGVFLGGFGFNPYIVPRTETEPFFDAHLGFQAGALVGSSADVVFGPHVSAAMRVGEFRDGSLMVGIAVDCLLGERSYGCGPLGEFRWMKLGAPK